MPTEAVTIATPVLYISGAVFLLIVLCLLYLGRKLGRYQAYREQARKRKLYNKAYAQYLEDKRKLQDEIRDRHNKELLDSAALTDEELEMELQSRIVAFSRPIGEHTEKLFMRNLPFLLTLRDMICNRKQGDRRGFHQLSLEARDKSRRDVGRSGGGRQL